MLRPESRLWLMARCCGQLMERKCASLCSSRLRYVIVCVCVPVPVCVGVVPCICTLHITAMLCGAHKSTQHCSYVQCTMLCGAHKSTLLCC